MTHNDLRYEFGPYQLNPSKRILTRAGEGIPLTPKATEILLVLVKHAGQLVEKDELLIETSHAFRSYALCRTVRPFATKPGNMTLDPNEKNQISDKLKRLLGTTQQPALQARIEKCVALVENNEQQ